MPAMSTRKAAKIRKIVKSIGSIGAFVTRQGVMDPFKAKNDLDKPIGQVGAMEGT